MKLNLIIAEAALELVPKELWRQPAVVRDAVRRGVQPGMVLLDRSFHHSAMENLRDGHKRGRPDLVHVALLSVTGSPMFDDARVKVFVQTICGDVLEFAEKTKIPKNYIRFRRLMEKALAERDGGPLIRVYKTSFKKLLINIQPDYVVGLSTCGRQFRLEELCAELTKRENPCVVVGGFPHGHFSEEITGLLDDLVRIHERSLEAHVVISRLLYELEEKIGGIND